MAARHWNSIPSRHHDLRLVVCDMDGTLLDERGEVPEGFWSLLDRMHAEGVSFVPASGRQHATLAKMFDRAPGEASFIAENGTLVVHEGIVVSTTCVDPATADRVIGTIRDATTKREGAPAPRDLGLVLCGRRSAYIERTDDAFVAGVEPYYAQLSVVDDLSAVEDDFLKLAVFVLGDAETTAPVLFPTVDAGHRMVVSNEHWIDIMAEGANKGVAVRALQNALGIAPKQTAVFGDYLNDLEMLDAAELSFAMGNAHPVVRDRARYLAPTNEQHGVVATLSHLLGF